MFSTEFKYSVVRYMFNDLADEAANVGLIAIADDPPKMLCKFIDDPTVKSRSDVRVRKEIVDRFKEFVTEQKQRYDNTPKENLPTANSLLTQISEFGSGIMRCNTARS